MRALIAFTRGLLLGVFLLPANGLAGGEMPQPITVRGDVDGDGQLDSATLTQDHERVWLSVRVGSRALQAFEFRADPAVQNAVCTLPVLLVRAAATCYPEGPDSGSLPGCVESPGKIDLAIEDGSCDVIHLYWNRDRERLEWWRR